MAYTDPATPRSGPEFQHRLTMARLAKIENDTEQIRFMVLCLLVANAILVVILGSTIARLVWAL
jgi:hypothetical protein